MNGYNGVYLMGNYPDGDFFVEAAVEGLKHFDFLEVGIPFSDPVADGPVIAGAAHEVLSRGFRLSGLMENIRRVRSAAAPGKKIYFMTYANIIHSRGIPEFAKLCSDNGISGVIVPDVPHAECGPFKEAFTRHGLEFIHLLSPENTPAQIKEIAQSAIGFLYFISIRGITGSELALDEETKGKISLAVTASRVPIVLGFGIRSGATAAEALRHAGGFVMGTRIVEEMKKRDICELRRLFEEIGNSAS